MLPAIRELFLFLDFHVTLHNPQRLYFARVCFLVLPQDVCANGHLLYCRWLGFFSWWPHCLARLSVSDLWRRLIPGRSRSSVTFLFSCPGCCAVPTVPYCTVPTVPTVLCSAVFLLPCYCSQLYFSASNTGCTGPLQNRSRSMTRAGR